jgi:hypothetical protein
LFGLNKEDLQRRPSPRYCEPAAAKVRVTHEIDSQWGCFRLHIGGETPFDVPLHSVLSVLNFVRLRFSSLCCPNALLPKETLNMGFTDLFELHRVSDL